MRSAALAIVSLAFAGSLAASAAPLLRAGVTVRDTFGGDEPTRYRIEVPAGDVHLMDVSPKQVI